MEPDGRRYLLNELMFGEYINFFDITAAYLATLQSKEKENKLTINGLAFPLCTYWRDDKSKKKFNLFSKSKAAYHLLKSKVFHTAPVEKDLSDWLKGHPYKEDENGYPITPTP